MLRMYKEVAALPASPSPDAIYIVRVGSGFALYVTNADGVPFPLNTLQFEVVSALPGTPDPNVLYLVQQ